MSALNISRRRTLRDGSTMPLFGLGCSLGLGAEDDVTRAVRNALKAGYRLFDTASWYESERCVGQALRESGLNRSEYFVVSKLRPDKHGYEEAKANIRESIIELSVGHIDLHLIHTSRPGKILETWRAMIELKKEGLLKSIGVSNFNIQHIQPIIDSGMEIPVVNQFEIHPWNQQRETVEFCRKHNIKVMGHCPLARNKFWSRSPIIEEISYRHNKTKQQVALRWALQHNFITIPRSSNPERILQNSRLFDWSLNDEEMASIDKLEEGLVCSAATCVMSEPYVEGPSNLPPWPGFTLR